MPINVYCPDKEVDKRVAWLCDGDWELPSQMDALEKWLVENEFELSNGPYIADIGFNIRKDACGGGCAITIEMMKIMIKIGMDLFLSEYPDDEDVNE